MVTNESTTFADGNIQIGKEKKVQQNKNGWQSVTIGGFTGILMGAGAMYAASTFGMESSATDQVDPATDQADDIVSSENNPVADHSNVAENMVKVAEVDQDLTFGQAFQTAREAVGPGGVFHWHGGVYNTYRMEEWNAMSADERQQFAQQVRPVILSDEHTVHDNDTAHNNVKQEEHAERKPEEHHDQNDEDSHKEEPHKDDVDGEVHFLGFTNVKLEGHDYEAGHVSARIDGEERHVYYIDLDHDDKNEFDIGLVDANDDGEFTLREAFDVRDGHINVDEFALASSMDEANQELVGNTNQTAYTVQDNIADDMPDYSNDADPII